MRTLKIRMPALSPTMEKGNLAKWLVAIGDVVATGDVIAEIETDKATMELEAESAGRVVTLIVSAGTEDVPVGTVIAHLESDMAVTSLANSGDGAGEVREVRFAQTSTIAKEPVEPGTPSDPIAGRMVGADAVPVSALAARLAAERGVSLASLAGSGPGGRILKSDVVPRKRIETPLTAGPNGFAPVAAISAAKVAIPAIPHDTRALSDEQKLKGQRLAAAKREIPHIYLTIDVRMDDLMSLHGRLNKNQANMPCISIEAMLIKALAAALMRVPSCNVAYTPTEIVQFGRADISVIVPASEGTVSAVVTMADGRSLSSIGARIADARKKPIADDLAATDVASGTATLTSLMDHGIKHFAAVISPPQAMTLAVGSIEQRPWSAAHGTTGIALMMSATGSFDHRAIDGADAARLMRAFRELVEDPLLLLC